MGQNRALSFLLGVSTGYISTLPAADIEASVQAMTDAINLAAMLVQWIV